MVPPIQLIRRKLYRPRVTAEYIKRPRLLAQLDRGLVLPVTLVAAPAGFGKSTLLASWLDRVTLPFAWVSLDEDDNDLLLFSSYLIAAVQTAFPGGLQVSAGLTSGGFLPDPARLAASLSNDIDELPAEFILVLDDLHAIRDTAVLGMLNSLLRHLPGQMHLVISSRTDAALPFSRLRAMGKLSELRARDLRFLPAETDQFLRQAVDRELDAGAVQLLQIRVEGWPVGLRFASMLLQEGADPQAVIENLVSGRRRTLMGYMLDEVLAHLRAPVRELILKTSLLDQFTAGMCDALLADDPVEKSSAILRELLDNDILLAIPGDNETWYRYHALFAEFLRAHARTAFPTETIAAVHLRTSEWYLANGMVTDAIQQAIDSGDIRAAAQIVYQNIHPALNREAGRILLEKWLGLFPREVVDRHLELTIARLWLAGIQFRLNAVPGLMARAEQLLALRKDLDPARRRRMQAEINGYLSGLYQWRNNGARALELAEKQYIDLPADAEFARASNLIEIALAQQMLGRTDDAVERLTRELRADLSPFFNRRVLLAFWAVAMYGGNLVKALDAAESLLRMSKESSPISLLWARYQLGLVYFEWNQLETAAQHLSAASELRYQGNDKAAHESVAFLVQTQIALGQTAQATKTMQELVRFTADLQSGEFEYHLAAHRAREALLLGKLDTAMRWATSVILNPRPHMLFEVEANLTRLHILFATQNTDTINTMLQDTEALVASARALNSTRRVIQLLALKAIALDALGNRHSALEALHESLRLAEPNGFVRSFIELGPRMMRLLNALVARGTASSYVRKLVNASPSGRQERAAAHTQKPILIEPLTNRELQVLEQLALRLTDKEIAQALVISPLTVKAHTDHIYQKLGVNNRQEAVKVGLAFGILDRSMSAPFTS